MKKLFFSFCVILSLTYVINTQAQELEVGEDFVRLLSNDGNGYLGLLHSGVLNYISNVDADWHPGFRCYVQRDLSVAFQVRSPNCENPPAFTIYGNGLVEKNGSLIHSDSTLKTDIEPLGVHSEKIKQLKCYQYYLKKDKLKNNHPTKRYGLIAQELEKIYPDLVFTNEKNLKSINYIELIPVLIEIVKDQQNTIENQQDNLSEMNALILDLQKRVNKLEKK